MRVFSVASSLLLLLLGVAETRSIRADAGSKFDVEVRGLMGDEEECLLIRQCCEEDW